MLGTKRKLKKKAGKTLPHAEVTEVPKSTPGVTQIPPPIPGEKLLAALQDWKNGYQEAVILNPDGERKNRSSEKKSKDLRLVFKCVDSNNKGFLNENEVQSALELLGFLVNNEGKEYIRKSINSNEGNLSFSAFQNLVADWHGLTRDFYRELRKGFSVIDFDKDGKITVSDLREASKLAGIKFSSKELEEMLQAADKNGDHAVDMSEFIEIMLKTNLF
ncbi:uncharacterized protein LOC142160261 [Mixophyes fleayi]|uniref:uncharacterized protein LOC142160261 n=1 Tax=Mixophyes fleayi TaxID=3061075 RepID=UPI003F4E177F